MQWSEQQEEVFRWFEGEPGNLVVRARAGTGKTTTILEGINRARDGRVLLAAFNKRIADELKTRLQSPDAEAATLHSLGYRLIRRTWGNCQVDQDRGWKIAMGVTTRGLTKAPTSVVQKVQKLAGLIKNVHTAEPKLSTTLDLLADYDLDADDEDKRAGWDDEALATTALKAVKTALTERDGTVDFDDMLALPVWNRWLRAQYDLVCIDEAQDMNAVQLALAMGVARGRIVVVGDDRQAIYGFRGADSGAIDRLKRELHAIEKPLNVTYRCPAKIVRYAQKLVPDYQAAPEAPEGVIDDQVVTRLADQVKPGDFVLSRTNAPLVRICLDLLRHGVRARVEGRDIGKTLDAIVRKLRVTTIIDLVAALDVWEAKQVQRAKLKAKSERAADEKAQLYRDQAETIRVLAAECEAIPELFTRITTLFNDQGPEQVVCSTIHKSKGLESDRVWLCGETLYRWPGSEEDEGERNIEYVAVTRAKRQLTWLTGVVEPRAKEPKEAV
jgi:superfamily I DNA/RNA helicase